MKMESQRANLPFWEFQKFLDPRKFQIAWGSVEPILKLPIINIFVSLSWFFVDYKNKVFTKFNCQACY